MQRLSHYGLNNGAALDKVPKLKPLMKTCENKLCYLNPPAIWDTVTQVFDKAIEAGELPPGTMYPITKKQWIDGYDPASPSSTGKTPTTNFHHLRRLVLGQIVKWCLSVVSKYCHICLEPLWNPKHLASLKTIHNRLAALDFDHCVPKLKDAQYHTSKMWREQPLVAFMTEEKKSGCFCHRPCHFIGQNMKD